MERGTDSQASSGSSYEVFLSFRGPDTRHGFTDCLYHGMVAAGILIFRDDESLRVGERIGGELLRAIENSKIYIPIFSTNYASSHWCLRELAYMVECASKSNGNKEILPIFFDVEPVDVKLKTNLYRQNLSQIQKTFRTEVKSWEKCLIDVGKIRGWNLKKDEGQGNLIQSVIQAILAKLNVSYKNVTEHLVGVDDRVDAIIKMLDVKSESVQFLAIHGMGGVGKTTLAKVVFNRLSSRFQGSNFLSDVRESSKRHGLVYLQKQLLSKFLDARSVNQIHDADGGINMIKRVLCSKKVLIVLDDMDEEKQLKSLAAKGNWFGSGSRIIVTTRYKSVLMTDGESTSEGLVKSANISTYEVREMKFHHALKLFDRHAFGRDFPPDHYVSLSEKVVSTLGKLPLALEVTGSSLSNKSKEFWVDTLKKLEKAPSKEVQKTLMITYERLDDAQRQVFLDIACFFVNEDKTYPFYMWDDCECFPNNTIEVLYLLSLIKIKDDNTFWMHDQVRDFGRAIVHEENFKDPCERSRVWNHREAPSILKQKEGSRKIEALSLGNRGDIITNDEVANLRNLRFLEGNGVFLVGDFTNLLPNLRWFSWRWCPHEFVATNFHPTNLVVLDLSHSSVSEKWIGWNQINVASKLKVLDLSNCENLMRTPDLSTLVSLERLILEDCRNLIEIVPSIGKLKLLTILNLKGCDSLQVLPEEIGCLQALTEIVMPKTLNELPRTFGNLRSLLILDVSHSRISKLPYSIGGLVKLRQLNLSGCTKIEKLPDSFEKLQFLVELDLSSTSLGHLPNSIGNLKQLKILRMTHISRITKLPSAIGLVEKLEELDASRCYNLTEVSKEIGRLSYLRILDLSYTLISSLPTTLSYLSNLQILKLESCLELKRLWGLPSSLTCLKWTSDEDVRYEWENITALPTLYSQLGIPSLPLELPKEVKLRSTIHIPSLPSSLRELELGNLEIDSSKFSNLKNLSTLRLNSCLIWEYTRAFFYNWQREITDMTNGRSFELGMEYSRHSNLRRREFLANALDLSPMKSLQEVHLLGFMHVVELCGLAELGSLCFLSVVDCNSMERMSGLSKLRQLRKLRVGECPKLRRLEGLNHLESLQKLWIHNCRSLESLADTSDLHLECSTIERCGRLPNRKSYCRCHDNTDSVVNKHDHAGYF
ncbi:disease resistance protein RPV1-like [Rhodamnia argentea]|uniref:Disease resistance protein RPV1-like n=1 Tax=Rhodamnia argentea TaxID=178133 RepID=A0ABM3HJ56_9MYRT|nr:disease resistance protein RPV1-like [Rhodamnia argentea]